MSLGTHVRLTGLLLALAVALVGCGGGDEAATDTATAEVELSEAASEPMASEMSSEPMASEMASDMAAEGCDLQPATSASDLNQQPAATAAVNNPNLTILAEAVEAADLVDTLNGEGPFTVFAPANCAFDAFPADELQALLDDNEQLTDVLTYHVVQGEALTAEDLAGMDSVTTIQGGDVTLAPEGDTLGLNDGQAAVLEADVEVSNGVIHVIDGVLMPGS